MARYIELDALVAMIKRHIKEESHSYFCKCLLSEIDTLEVKEVDLDKEVDDEMKRFLGNITCREEQLKFAKHFYELGLKAQKGE